MKTLPSLFGIAAALLLCSCSTPYQKAGFAGGLSETRHDRNRFTIGFAGNGYTTGQRAIDLCLLRCAEVTLGCGFHYFVLTSGKTEYDRSTAVTTGSFVPTGYGGGVFLSTTQIIPKPGVVNTIQCFRESPEGLADVFDAERIYQTLSRKYRINRPPEQLAKFTLRKAALGVAFEVVKPHAVVAHGGKGQNQTHPSPSTSSPKVKIRDLQQASPAHEAGLHVGDEVLAIDDLPLLDSRQVIDIPGGWEVGQTVAVKVRRHDKDLTIPVKTVFNPSLRFKPTSDVKCGYPITEKEVTVILGDAPGPEGFVVAEYVDWENPVESLDEFKNYAVCAAAQQRANGVRILKSRREVRNWDPKSNEQAGFLCQLLVIPKAGIGVQFETGTGYENRRVIRRLQSSESVAAGLRIGDNVLAVNGIDLLRIADAAADRLKWTVGQTATVTVARDGRELTIPVKTTSNL